MLAGQVYGPGPTGCWEWSVCVVRCKNYSDEFVAVCHLKVQGNDPRTVPHRKVR